MTVNPYVEQKTMFRDTVLSIDSAERKEASYESTG